VLVISLNEASAEKIMKHLKEFGVFLSIQIANLSSALKGIILIIIVRFIFMIIIFD
jgi:hypothetical protein